MYKLICCDLDDTLLNSEKKISKRNKEAIKKVRERGVKFVITTGRVISAISEILEELELKAEKDEFVISLNGGAIWENSGKLLYQNHLPRNLAEEIFKQGLSFDNCIRVYSKDSFWGYKLDRDSHLKETYQNANTGLKEFFEPNLDFLKDEIVKLVFIDDDGAKLKTIEQEMKNLSSELEITYSSARSLEINHKGVDKGSGVLKLCEILGIKREESIAVGDNFNDVAMLKAAGLGICVQNAVPEIKKICGYVCQANNNESALAEVIEKFIFNN